jgi:tryptophanyl-tRNA synthetase
MGKSEGEGNAIFLIDDEKTISKKIMRAVTDAGPTEANQTPPQAIANLFALLDIVSTADTAAFFRESYANCTIRYGDLKKQLAVDMNNFVAPIRERIIDVVSNDALISKIAATGREKARESASKTIEEVRQIIGFKTI